MRLLPLLLCLWIVPALAHFNPKTEIDQIGFTQQVDQTVPGDMVFADEQGQSVQLAKLLTGVPVLLVPVYYRCPNLCGLTLDNLASSLTQVDLRAGQDYQVVAFSIDPGETPQAAAAKKAELEARHPRLDIAASWTLLTGEEARIHRLANAIGFRYRYDPDIDQYAHAAGVVLLTDSGRISRYLFGMLLPPKDLRLALLEASQGGIGSVTDQLLLLCYHYDPVTGRYSFTILKTLRLAGLVTMLALASTVGVFLWREKRRQRHA